MDIKNKYVTFNPAKELEDVVKLLPHAVEVGSNSYLCGSDEAYYWCRSKCNDLFTDYYDQSSDEFFYRFKDPNDAMRFKLTFI